MHNYPDTVPWLEADDICKQYLVKGSRRCLFGWVLKVFRDHDLQVKIMELLQQEVGCCPIQFNDRKPRAAVADVWNTVMHDRLGYTELSPR